MTEATRECKFWVGNADVPDIVVFFGIAAL